ncbi:MAG: methionine synthase [Actinomycetes bacterium]
MSLAGVATGIGSLPGDDPRAAAALAVESLPELPHVPELPERGPWAQLAGRASAVLVDLPVEWEGNAWRVALRPGRDMRRARSLLAEDLDAVEDRLQGYQGRAKLQMCGPLTLAAVLELRSGTAAISDASAVADLAASLAEGVCDHLRDVRRRVPGAEWAVQLDEPALSAVTNGAVPRASGWGTLAALESVEAGRLLSAVLGPLVDDEVPVVVHSCASDPDWVALTSGAVGAAAHRAISVDLEVIDLEASAPAMEAWLDAGGVLWLGVDPLGGGALSGGTAEADDPALEKIEAARTMLGIAPEHFGDRFAITPSCGIAGSADVARESYAGVQRLIRRLRGDSPDEGAEGYERGSR